MNPTKFLKLLAISMLAAGGALATPMAAVIPVSSTSAKSPPLSAGYAYLNCDQDTHYAVGSSSVVAVTTDKRAAKDLFVPVAVTSGQYVAVIMPAGGNGICRINQFDSTEWASTFASLVVSGDETIGGNLIASSARGQELNFGKGDAGFSSLQVGANGSNLFNVDSLGNASLNSADLLVASTTSDIRVTAARGPNLDWAVGDAGVSNLSAKFITTNPEAFCNTTGVTGTAACNGMVSGIGRMGTGDYFTVYNTSMPTNAYVDATLGSTDATCVSIKSVIVDAGFGAVLTPGAACSTAETIVRWRIVDAPNF